ncbi:nose resistant to fluoxetine protein 6 [Papilio machaon]|uniref:nose resistant to fluoxetine protein 6 n=1 Tax=Papilio machaon TaxID=76193 RepID=UPI001E666108|nr:nose resistant to fluoxetine protein 6 [Papilio machaon]
MIKFILTTLFLLDGALAVIYQLNETEYNKMPPMFRLDPYAPCVHEPGGVYCAVEFTLVADEDNPLLTMIQEYSARREMHFNHSRLHRGICVTNTCKDYLSQNTSADLRLVLEGCLNDTLWKEYKLKSKISSEVLCNDLDNKMDIDYGDIAVAVICLSILLLHVIGNLYDFCYVPNKDRKGNKLLLCFSIKRNWKKLVAPPACGPDTRLKRLKGFNGLRSLSIIIVIMEHSLLPFVVSSENSHNFEIKYYNIICHLFIDGTLVVQTFFLMSGCLLAYNLDLLAEKKNISWTMIPKGIILRWLRLTPTYALVLAVTTTWLRFAGSGPLWQSTVGVEVKDCRRDGWLNLIYLNNYIDESQCMPQTWYIAADMQLYVVGLIIFSLVTSGVARRVILTVLFVVSLIIPACHTYFQNLDAGLVISPELVRDYFVKDPTFNHTYKRGHTNLASYIMGLGLGMLIYHLQENDFSFERFKKYKYLYWATVPAVLIILPSGSFFYFYETEAPIILKAIFSGIAKPVFSSIICIIVLGMAFKFEDVYRGILEWNGWASPARVSYCTYILHVLFVRTLTGSRTTLMHVSIANVLLVCLGTVMMTYLVAYPFYLLVEAPSIALSKIILPVAKVKKDIENDPTKWERNHA